MTTGGAVRTWLLPGVIVLALAAITRFPNMGSDVPMDVEGTNAPSLDAFWYLEAASSRADGVLLEPNPAYDLGTWAGTARVWFLVFGSGLLQACALGAAVGTLTVLCGAIAARGLGARPSFVTGLLLALAYPFAQLARTPIVYGPVALAMTATAAFYLVPATKGARACAWAMALALPFFLKPHAAALIPGLIAAEVVRAPERLRRRTLLVGLAAAPVLAAVAWANLERLEAYSGPLEIGGLVERALRMAGRHPLSSFPSAHEGGTSLAALSPALLALAVFGLWLAWTDLDRLPESARATLALAAGWAAAFMLASIPLDYRPIRYFVPVFPPAAILAGYATIRLLRGAPTGPDPPLRGLDLVLGGVIGAVFAAHSVDLASQLIGRESSRGDLAVAAALGSLAVLAALVLRLRPRRALVRIVAIALVTLSSLDVLRDMAALARPTWSIAHARRTARLVLGDRAVLAGPYASVLALGTRLERRRAGQLGLAPSSTPFETIAAFRGPRYTHFAIDVQQAWDFGLEPRLRAAGAAPRLVSVLYLRGEPVLLYRFHWAEELGYDPSPFETARDIEVRSGSRAAGEAFALAGADRDEGLILARARTLAQTGHASEALEVAREGLSRNPDHPELAVLVRDLEQWSSR